MINFDGTFVPTNSNILTILRDLEFCWNEIFCSIVDGTEPISCEPIQYIDAIDRFSGGLSDDDDIFMILTVRNTKCTWGKRKVPVVLELTTSKNSQHEKEESPLHGSDNILLNHLLRN